MQVFEEKCDKTVRRQICTKLGKINGNRNVIVLLLR